METANFSEKQYSETAPISRELLLQGGQFLKKLLFYSSHYFTKYFFRRWIFSQLNFLSTTALLIYQLAIKWVQRQSRTKIVWVFFLLYLLLHSHTIDITHLTSLMLNVLWDNYFYNKLHYQSLFFSMTATFSTQLLLCKSYFFRNYLFRIVSFSPLTSSS